MTESDVDAELAAVGQAALDFAAAATVALAFVAIRSCSACSRPATRVLGSSAGSSSPVS